MALAPRGGEYERGYPPSHLGGPEIPWENLERRSAREAFLSLFLVKVSGFKLNDESQFDIFLCNILLQFQLILVLYWHTK